MQFGGIILAGGRSRRMGRDKGLMEYNGKLLVEYAIDLLSPYCRELLISANDKSYEQFGYPVVKDEVKNIGPAGGISSALKASEYDLNIVVSCDMPFLNNKAVKLLLESAGEDRCVIPVHHGKVEPLFGIYPKKIQSSLIEAIAINEFKMKKILEMYGATFINFEHLINEYPHIFKNLNFLSDLNT